MSPVGPVSTIRRNALFDRCWGFSGHEADIANLTMMTRSGYRRVPDPICLSLSRQPAIEDLSRTGMTTADGPSPQVWPHTVLARSDIARRVACDLAALANANKVRAAFR